MVVEKSSVERKLADKARSVNPFFSTVSQGVQQTNQRPCISHFNTHFPNDANESISSFSYFGANTCTIYQAVGINAGRPFIFQGRGVGIPFYRESKPGIKIALQVMSLMVSLPFMLAARWCVVYHRPTTDERYLVYMHPLDFFLCS